MWEYNYTLSYDELQHHGIIGMRWGVRRYQNADGTLTALGRKRFSKDMEKVKAQGNKRAKAKFRTDVSEAAYNNSKAKLASLEASNAKKSEIRAVKKSVDSLADLYKFNLKDLEKQTEKSQKIAKKYVERYSQYTVNENGDVVEKKR